MHRFFLRELFNPLSREFRLSQSDSHYVVRVLRLAPGDRIELVDKNGNGYIGEMLVSNPREVKGRIVETQAFKSAEPETRITVYQGYPKGRKIETVIEHCVPVGVSRIVPVFTKRSVIQQEAHFSGTRLTRWRKIAQESAQVAHRTSIPEISEPVTFGQMLEEISAQKNHRTTATLMFWEEEKDNHLRDVLDKMAGVRNLSVIVGPEGGLTRDEASRAEESGVLTVGLGNRILRTEIAAMVAVVMVMYHRNEI